MYVDLMGTEKKFIKAYDDYLATQRKLKWKISMYYAWQRMAGSSSTANASNKFVKLRRELQEKEDLAKKLHYERNKFNEIPDSFTLNNAEKFWWKKMSADKYHQDGITEWYENSKWVSEDWKSEVVFSYDGKIVNDINNMWTYNFYPWRVWTVILHFKYDVDPWKKWWSGPNDTNSLR